MKPNMAKTSQDFSSKRHFHWTKKVGTDDDDQAPAIKPSTNTTEEEEEEEEKKQNTNTKPFQASSLQTTPKKKLPAVAVSRLKTVLSAFGKHRSNLPLGLGTRVIGTLFGSKRGHVHFAIQKDPNSTPAFLVELATPISGLVREMASGLVRIALECDKEKEDDVHEKNKAVRLLEEPMWRTYCNGKKCGFATRRECGAKEWKVLKSVEPISMGAGVLPANGDETKANANNGTGSGSGADGEVMFMRAKFERIVGSRDSEAFYMMNPDSNGTPELSVYLLRI